MSFWTGKFGIQNSITKSLLYALWVSYHFLIDSKCVAYSLNFCGTTFIVDYF